MENVHFSSKTDLWATPQEFFDKYDKFLTLKQMFVQTKKMQSVISSLHKKMMV